MVHGQSQEDKIARARRPVARLSPAKFIDFTMAPDACDIGDKLRHRLMAIRMICDTNGSRRVLRSLFRRGHTAPPEFSILGSVKDKAAGMADQAIGKAKQAVGNDRGSVVL
jgi:hypothetical protein